MPPVQKEPSVTDGIFNDPDVENSEQNEQGTQAQDVAEEALHPAEFEGPTSAESEPGSHQNAADLVPRDVPDLVDNMNAMLRTGSIDMAAYDGESGMDDEDDEDDE